MAGSWLFECFDSCSFDTLEQSPSENTDSAATSTATTTTAIDAGTPDDDDRAYRKKSREKMRRNEVNEKFDELIDLLGLSNRMRKSVILHEAVLAIKALRRDHDELRNDRDRLQQEISQLASCLHAGSVPMPQMPDDYMLTATHQSMYSNVGAFQSPQTPYTPNGSYFPVSPGFPAIAPSSSKPTACPIAPKTTKPLRDANLAHREC